MTSRFVSFLFILRRCHTAIILLQIHCLDKIASSIHPLAVYAQKLFRFFLCEHHQLSTVFLIILLKSLIFVEPYSDKEKPPSAIQTSREYVIVGYKSQESRKGVNRTRGRKRNQNQQSYIFVQFINSPIPFLPFFHFIPSLLFYSFRVHVYSSDSPSSFCSISFTPIFIPSIPDSFRIFLLLAFTFITKSGDFVH